MIDHGESWALGNREPYGRTGAIDLAVRLPTPSGTRILVTGFDPAPLSAFTARELDKVPGVKGAHHYLLDGNGVVIASTNPARPPGYVFHTPTQIDVLTRPSGTVKGHYFDQVPLANSTWKVLLAAPDGPFFASVSGARHWLPWVIFAAFSIVALVALLLAVRALRNSELVVEANAKLAASNAELERRARELSRSNAELEQFASIASHDLQEPLRKVRTFTGRVRETEAETISERGLDYLRRADASAERMQRLIEDLLVFSRVAMQTRRVRARRPRQGHARGARGPRRPGPPLRRDRPCRVASDGHRRRAADAPARSEPALQRAQVPSRRRDTRGPDRRHRGRREDDS